MTPLVILTEEPSAAIVARALAETFAPGRVMHVVEHEGRSDLCESFPRKIRGWRHPADTRFIILHDHDSDDCMNRKARLAALVPDNHSHRTRIRLIMQELESWYLGAPSALAESGIISRGDLRRFEGKAKSGTRTDCRTPSRSFSN